MCKDDNGCVRIPEYDIGTDGCNPLGEYRERFAAGDSAMVRMPENKVGALLDGFERGRW